MIAASRFAFSASAACFALSAAANPGFGRSSGTVAKSSTTPSSGEGPIFRRAMTFARSSSFM